MVLRLFFLIFLSSCALVPERRYSDLMDESEPIYVPERDFVLAVGDSGQRYLSMDEVMARTPASSEGGSAEELRERDSLRRELQVAESSQPPVFMEMYWQYKEYFRNDSERIYFLSLSSMKEREDYLKSRNMLTGGSTKSVSELLQKEDRSSILTGMNPIQVRRIHGNPSFIESTGTDSYRDRWAYKMPYGRVRYIYFDEGQVTGWSEEVSP